MHTQKHTHKIHYSTRSQLDWMFLHKMSLWNQTNPVRRNNPELLLSNNVWMSFEHAYVWNINSFFFAMRLCECVFLLWTRILDERLIIMQSFMLTDDEMESQPTLREFYQTFKEDFWEQAGNVRRQRYDDVAKDTDFREALIIFYTSKHTLINLCLRSLSGFHFLWGLFIDCQRLTITSEALTSPTLKSGHTYLKLLLIISPHKQIITCIPSSARLLCLNLK